MNIIGTTEALEALNKRLQRPITRQLFNQSIAPELLSAGYAQQIGRSVIIDAEAWSWWIDYIAFRERKITAGDWLSNRPYSAEEAEDFRDGMYTVKVEDEE